VPLRLRIQRIEIMGSFHGFHPFPPMP
jgi:hypothetical protein